MNLASPERRLNNMTYDDHVDCDRQLNEAEERIKELEGKLKWHKEEKLRLEKEVHTLREREYCEDCSAKTILPEPHGIGCKAKKRITELEAGVLQVVADSNNLQLQAAEKIKELEGYKDEHWSNGYEIEKLKNLRDTVSISCNPPADCNDPKVLKTYMKACFDEAEKLYD